VRVFWKSWSPLEAEFELDRLQGLLKNEWVDANKRQDMGPRDLYLSTNGYYYKSGNFHKACLYWEGYTYLKNEYKNFDRDSRWEHRFHFNPIFANKPRCSLIGIGSFWKRELELFNELKKNKKFDFTFGMVLGFKKKGEETSDIGYLRQEIIKAGAGRSFKYYGTGWPSGDPNYGGEAYLTGKRSSPLKFNDARRLMSNIKFVFALENTYDPVYSQGYLTEKIFHGFLSGSIPIYLGCYNIEKLIPPDLFVDLRKFNLNIKSAMDYCEKMSQMEYDGYRERINRWLDTSGLAFSCEHRFQELDAKITELWAIRTS